MSEKIYLPKTGEECTYCGDFIEEHFWNEKTQTWDCIFNGKDKDHGDCHLQLMGVELI